VFEEFFQGTSRRRLQSNSFLFSELEDRDDEEDECLKRTPSK